CVARLGAKPVFADSCPVSFNIRVDTLESLITPRTRAIIPVHLYGQPADMDPLMEIARRHGLAVIEDAAQSFSAEYRGKPVGSIGDFGTVSFFPSKNLGALGEAGLLVTNNSELSDKARLLRDHGMHPRYFHSIVGGNFRLDAVQAALLSVKLPHLSEYTSGRQRNACDYTRALEHLKGGEVVQVLTPATRPDRTHIFNQYTLRVRRAEGWQWAESPRDALRRW